jgi:hypothetical protein
MGQIKVMKNYPTPESDAAWDGAFDEGGCYPEVLIEKSRDLERRLAECREFIRDAIDYSHLEEMHKQPAEELLTNTAPKP